LAKEDAQASNLAAPKHLLRPFRIQRQNPRPRVGQGLARVLRYLAQPRQSLTRVSELVGYGQLSSFTRWFINQFRETASAWRRRMLQGGPDPRPDPSRCARAVPAHS
jgi:AraC-like DNA-binding protein